MRRTNAIVGLAVAVVLAGPLALAQGGPPAACPGVSARGPWTSITVPAFSSGPPVATAYAVDPLAPLRLVVTNGTTVAASSDGGCTWHEIFSAATLPTLDAAIAGPAASVTDVDIAADGQGTGRILLVVEETIGPARRVHVVTSDDDGATWSSRADSGLPPVSGRAIGLSVAPSDPDVAYLVVRQAPEAGGDHVYASSDEGTTFVRRSASADVVTSGFAIDPLDPEDLWFWGGQGLFHSVDGGRSRVRIDYVAAPVPMADVFHAPGGAARIMAYEGETQTFNVSEDGGRTWHTISGPPGFAISMAHGATPDEVVVSVHGGVLRFLPPGYWIEITPEEMKQEEDPLDLRALSADRTARPSIYALTGPTIEAYTGLDEHVDLDAFDQVLPDGAGDLLALTPRRTRVVVPHGERRGVDYRLHLPPQPTPLDVFFLVDTTQSMQSSINGLREGMHRIITELTETGLDVQFGVGEYRDYPIPGYGEPSAGDRPYALLRSIGPADAELADALERLEAHGGGDIPESQLTALFQAATGDGDQPGLVEPGQDAGFRPQALPVIVNITDAPFHSSAAYPAPPFDSVATTLRARGILQIGLAVFGPNGIAGAAAHLRSMAGQTGTVAPRAGVDCDADDSIDLTEGEPLVCEIRDETAQGVLNLTPGIIATLKAVTQEVEVELDARGREELVATITPPVYEQVDIRDRAALDFTVTFDCPPSAAGSRDQVRLDALVRGAPVAAAVADVRCLPPPPSPALPLPPEVVAAAAPPPVTRVLLPPPPPVANEIPAPQQYPQAQGVVAHQRQEQPQMAFVHSAWQSAPQEEYAFSSLQRERDEAPIWLYGAGAVMGFAFLKLRTAAVRVARVTRT